jgi:hypothetical protein
MDKIDRFSKYDSLIVALGKADNHDAVQLCYLAQKALKKIIEEEREHERKN